MLPQVFTEHVVAQPISNFEPFTTFDNDDDVERIEFNVA